MHQHTLTELIDGLAAKAFSSEELTRHYLDRIRRLDRHYNSFITVTEQQALDAARCADRALAQGEQAPLCGIPIAHKDIFCTAGIKTSCGSKMLDNFIAPYNATMVAQCQQAGAVLLGKTNMDEFAMGSSNENSYYGAVRNPWRTDCVSGGSSGGSAAAVAAQLAVAATGTDTGGSVRQPAALCGVVGLKPTYGRVSRYGMVSFASSLDQAGVMTRTVADAAIMLQAMAGFDNRDSTSMDHPVPDYSATLNDDITGLRIGLPNEYFAAGLHPEIEQAVRLAVRELEALGATVTAISLPHTELAIPCYYVIAPAEASANLARYDGVRYGYRCADPVDLLDLYTRTREEGFGAEVKRRILVGTYTLSAGFYDAYYGRAQKIRRLIKQDFIDAFKQVDVIAAPTTPHPAFALGEKCDDPLAMYLEDIYTIPASLSGLPALSLPVGFAGDKPVGLQLIGRDWEEARLLNIGHRLQQVTHWHRCVAPAVEEIADE